MTWDERWCLIPLHTPTLGSVRAATQCEHANAPGRYVVLSRGVWCIFDPPTKLQALSWVNHKPEREARMRWQCNECGQVMPLASYSDAAYAAGAPRLEKKS